MSAEMVTKRRGFGRTGVGRLGWPRARAASAIRDVVQVAGLGPLVRAEVSLDVQGLDELAQFHEPAIIVANHASHLDTAVLLTTLPPERRRRTAVAAAADYFFDTWWRAAGSAMVFNTFPIERKGGSESDIPGALLSKGWSVLVYPEGTRSVDGYIGRFRMGAAWLAVQHQVPVIPVGLRGTYAAMPRGRGWPIQGRPRVSVRFGTPIRPRAGETPRELAPKVANAVRQLVAEDETTWWRTQRRGPVPLTAAGGGQVAGPPPAGSWRRVWEQTAPPIKGGRTEEKRIWRR